MKLYNVLGLPNVQHGTNSKFVIDSVSQSFKFPLNQQLTELHNFLREFGDSLLRQQRSILQNRESVHKHLQLVFAGERAITHQHLTVPFCLHLMEHRCVILTGLPAPTIYTVTLSVRGLCISFLQNRQVRPGWLYSNGYQLLEEVTAYSPLFRWSGWMGGREVKICTLVCYSAALMSRQTHANTNPLKEKIPVFSEWSMQTYSTLTVDTA